jgi:hypothetical protein
METQFAYGDVTEMVFSAIRTAHDRHEELTDPNLPYNFRVASLSAKLGMVALEAARESDDGEHRRKMREQLISAVVSCTAWIEVLTLADVA